jgi:hypothetical protein
VRVDDRGRVNANSDPGEDAVLDAVAEVHVVEDGIGVGGLVSKDTVVDVEQELLCVRGVWLKSLGLVDELLVEEELADMGDVATSEGLVLSVDCSVDVRKNCSVVSTFSQKLKL